MALALRRVAALYLTALVCACGPDHVGVLDRDPLAHTDRQQLENAVRDLAAEPTSPNAYRRFAAGVGSLLPAWEAEVAQEAQLRLIFMAAGPLLSLPGESADERMMLLATTVWPTFLGVEPLDADEAPQHYIGRVCELDLKRICERFVAEYQAVMFEHIVWQIISSRADDAYKECSLCLNEPRYADVRQRYAAHAASAQLRAQAAGEAASPLSWPVAGDRAASWSPVTIARISSGGTADYGGYPLPDDKQLWSKPLRNHRNGQTTLGLHVRPNARVSALRQIIVAARQAGFEEVIMQAREHDYPFALRGYRLTEGLLDQTRLRGTDIAQVLVRALDHQSR